MKEILGGLAAVIGGVTIVAMLAAWLLTGDTGRATEIGIYGIVPLLFVAALGNVFRK